MFQKKATSALLAAMIATGLITGCSSTTTSTAQVEVDQEKMYEMGLSQMEKGKYANAAEYFRSAGDYEDAAEKMLEAEYAYILEQKSIVTSAGRKYMNELLEANYEDIQEIAEKFGYESTAE